MYKYTRAQRKELLSMCSKISLAIKDNRNNAKKANMNIMAIVGYCLNNGEI